MIKKVYLQPEIMVAESEQQLLLTDSLVNIATTGFDRGDELEQPEDGQSKNGDIWFDGM